MYMEIYQISNRQERALCIRYITIMSANPPTLPTGPLRDGLALQK